MRLSVLSLAALCAAVAAAPLTRAEDEKKSDEKYTIKVARFPAKGQPIKADETIQQDAKVTVTDGDGNVVMDAKEDKTAVRVYVEKTLSVANGKRTRYSRKFEKATDKAGGESENKPYQGRTIVFEKSDGKWSTTAEGDATLSEDDLKELTEQARRADDPERSQDAFYPRKPVKVGEKWALSGKEVAKAFDTLKMDPETVKGEGKLVKAYKKGQQQWGTVEVAITFEGDLGNLKKAKGKLTGTIDQPIDASSAESRGKMEIRWAGKAAIEQNCMKFNVDYDVKVKAQIVRTAAK